VALLTRPITLALLSITGVTVFLLLRFEGKGATLDAVVPVLAEGAAGAPPRPALPARRGLVPLVGGPWKYEHWFALAILIVVGAALWTSLDFPARARFMPFLTGGPIVALTLFQLLFMRRSVSGEIMDIGLRSVAVPGAGKTAALIGGFIALLLLLSVTIGLQYAVIAFAVSFPLVMSDGRMRWIASASAGTLVAVISLWLLDHYMGVLWPQAVFAEWISAYL
jgi:hypothetical protein